MFWLTLEVLFSILVVSLLIHLSSLKERYPDLSRSGWSKLTIGLILILVTGLVRIATQLPLEKPIFGSPVIPAFLQLAFLIAGLLVMVSGISRWLALVQKEKELTNARQQEIGFVRSAIAQTHTDTTLVQLLSGFLKTVTGHFKTDQAALWIYNQSGKNLILASSRNLDPALAKGFESLEAGEGVLKQVLSGEAYFAVQSKADSDVFMKLLNQSEIESAVCIPLPARDSQIGALAILSHQKFRFSKEDQSLLEEATYYLGEKIEFLRVAREIRRKSEGLNQAIAENRILANLSGRLASESRLEVLLDRILWEGLKVIEAKTGHLFVLEGETLEAKASLEPATSGSKGNIAEYPLAKRMLSGKSPLSERGNLLVPVMVEGNPAGLLWYEKPEPEKSFSRAEIERAQVLANQAALAIGKWKLLELVEKLRQSNLELSDKLSGIENRMTVAGPEAELLHPSITNDLNNHLAAVLGNLELIQKQIQFNSTPEMQAFSGNLKEVETAALQAAELLRTVDQPKVIVPALDEPHAGNNQKPALIRALRILSIDDQKMILDLLESMLSTMGHETEVASNGLDGLEKFRRNSFDVVITDLGMPDISGFEIASQVKKIKPDMPVILITGWGSNFDEAQLKQAGVDYLLAKPFRLEQLREVIGKITNP